MEPGPKASECTSLIPRRAQATASRSGGGVAGDSRPNVRRTMAIPPARAVAASNAMTQDRRLGDVGRSLTRRSERFDAISAS